MGIKITVLKKGCLNEIQKSKQRFGSKGRKIILEEDDYQLRDVQAGYGHTGHFNSENSFYGIPASNLQVPMLIGWPILPLKWHR